MKTVRKVIDDKLKPVSLDKEEEQKLIDKTMKKNLNRLAKVSSFITSKENADIVKNIDLDKNKVIELIYSQIAESLSDVVNDYVEDLIDNKKI